MKSFASVALLATLVFISAEARPSEDDMIVGLVLGQSENYSMLKLADIMERYGKKLALVGRIISNLGDSITGIGRWLKQRNGQAIEYRAALTKIGEELSVKEMASSEAYIASKVLIATLKQAAENEALTDSQLENYLSKSLTSISGNLISATKDADVDANKVDDATLEIFERMIGDF